MFSFFFWKILFVCTLFSSSLFSWDLSQEEADAIGQKIYFNECRCQEEKLVWWNEGENFASLGIGHFIWYPEGQKGPFEETFPLLLAFFYEKGIAVPDWLKNFKGCPWNSKGAYLEKGEALKKKALQDFLAASIAHQAQFIACRFEEVLPLLLNSLSEKQKTHVAKQIRLLEMSSKGKFALIDYLNFKGSGLSETETYRGEGWGLKQVLENMPDDERNPLGSFVKTAQQLLKQRVENAPSERNEQRWLQGWLARVEGYLKS